jgi:hypothetical protein
MRDGVVRQAGINQRIVARWLAHARIEEVIADRHSLVSTKGYASITTGNYTVESAVAGFPGFGRSVNVVETNHTLVAAGTGYKRVTVTVTWKDAQRGNSSFQLQTIITDY